MHALASVVCPAAVPLVQKPHHRQQLAPFNHCNRTQVQHLQTNTHCFFTPVQRQPAQQRANITVARAAAVDIGSAEAQPVLNGVGEPTRFPNAAGVYAVYDKENKIQYIGLSRKLAMSVANHAEDLPELVYAVKYAVVEDASRENLTAVWKQWVEAAVAESGTIPPGNAPGQNTWTARRSKAVKPEIRLTPGKGAADLMVPLQTIVDQVVKSNKVVAFVKGTRTAPECGFSYKMLSILNENKAEYEVVNVLDEVHNPGLRDTIKTYSQWPTIPQLYVKGEFVGGSDIVEELQKSGELLEMLRQ